MTADPQNDKPRKERLRRLELIFPSSPIYFVTACTFNRKGILATSMIHDAFLRFAAEGEKHGAYVGAFIIMPDHIHLFVALEQDAMLSTWMKSLKNSLSKPSGWTFSAALAEGILRSHAAKRGILFAEMGVCAR